MKANVKRPARFSFKTITEKKAKHLTLIFVAVLFLMIVVLALFPLLDREEERYEVTTYAMGSYVQQTVYGENREDAAVKAADAVEALEQKISWRVANSDVQKLNNNAGKDWVTLSDETLNVLTQAQSVSEKSGGAFDVTIAPISRLWDFDDELNEVPDSDLITSLLPYVNYSLLRIDETEQTASLKNLGMAVDLGSVGKGAACDAAVRAYEEAGAKAAIIAVGGSVGVYGEKSSGKPWSVAVRDPNGKIQVETKDVNSISDRYPILKKPMLRGTVSLIESLVLGIRSLSYSAKMAGEDEDEPGHAGDLHRSMGSSPGT